MFFFQQKKNEKWILKTRKATNQVKESSENWEQRIPWVQIKWTKEKTEETKTKTETLSSNKWTKEKSERKKKKQIMNYGESVLKKVIAKIE